MENLLSSIPPKLVTGWERRRYLLMNVSREWIITLIRA